MSAACGMITGTATPNPSKRVVETTVTSWAAGCFVRPAPLFAPPGALFVPSDAPCELPEPCEPSELKVNRWVSRRGRPSPSSHASNGTRVTVNPLAAARNGSCAPGPTAW